MNYIEIPPEQSFFFHHDIRTKNTGEEIIEKHYHNHFEIYFIEDGSCSYFINNKAYKLQPGDIVLVPEGIIHNTLYENSMHSRFLINCTRSFLPTVAIPFMHSDLFLYRNHNIKDQLYDIFCKIENEYNNPDKISEDIIRCYVHMLFFLLVRNENKYNDIYTKNDYIEQAVNFIQKNYASEISLSATAQMFSVSPEHFSRIFKKETGFGFCEYVTLVRLQNAEMYIKQSDKISVTKIASKCGFNDSNYFSLKFKKMYGISPKQMHKNIKTKK